MTLWLWLKKNAVAVAVAVARAPHIAYFKPHSALLRLKKVQFQQMSFCGRYWNLNIEYWRRISIYTIIHHQWSEKMGMLKWRWWRWWSHRDYLCGQKISIIIIIYSMMHSTKSDIFLYEIVDVNCTTSLSNR